MEPAERELRANLAPLVAERPARGRRAHGLADDAGAVPGVARASEAPWRMDRFYRGARRATGLMMQDGKPEGGRFSFDGDNRKSWKGDPGRARRRRASSPTP